ncbi:creatininase family protein [Phyllobacterium myrsinacearum]|uniref:Creatinine amidohydrolase n=1 Tax=Phyllobacterium myrsinacearum TaxID=28101 RepID=A0A839EUP5_9HYPH|nr:creatininase family protein [Phyllobacterium myrsinacearum]MBA8881224.1 creatinine amidohydrolase [Phyllobacterium myrsinacearum]
MPAHSVSKIALLPLGAHEQHGPHLPFETDSLIAQGLISRLKPALPSRLSVDFLPVEPVGYSIEHMDVAGTKTLAFDEAVCRWIDIGKGVAERGLSKLVILNAHGGNAPLMTIVATELRIRFNMLAVATSWTRFGLPDGLISPEEKTLDIHGGFIETSVMLALYPDRVDMAKAQNFDSNQRAYIQNYKHLRAYGPHAFGWKMSDLNRLGVAGDASRATAEAGEKIIAHSLKGIIELLDDVDRFDSSVLQP